MNQHKSIFQLCPVKSAVCSGNCMQITDQGTGKLQIRADKTFRGMDECTMDAYMDIRLMNRQALKGAQITTKEIPACKKKTSA